MQNAIAFVATGHSPRFTQMMDNNPFHGPDNCITVL